MSIAQKIMCDEEIRPSVPSQLASMKLTYLTPSQRGDGDVFYGPKKTIAGSPYNIETWFVVKSFKERKFADIGPEIGNIVGMPEGYYTFADTLHINCSERKQQIPMLEYLDQRKQSNIFERAGCLLSPWTLRTGRFLQWRLMRSAVGM